MLEQLVAAFIEKYKFDRYIIAYSGGVDSQVLLHAFSKIVPEKTVAFHINHGISTNAKAWEDFCSSTCEQLGVDFHVKHFSLKGESNLENKARVARYGAFSEVVTESAALVTGHHMNDQVETFMLNLMRGAGLDGLSAMPEIKPFGQGFHVRPFLSVSKEDLVAYAVKESLSWVEDESNNDSVYDRNFIRNEVMPLLKSRWNNADSAICNSVQHVQKAKKFVDESNADFDVTADKIKIETLVKETEYVQTNIIRKWVYAHLGKSASQNMVNVILTEIIPAKDDAKMKWEQKDYFITRFNGFLYFVKKEEKKYDINELLKMAGIDIPLTDVTVVKRVNGAVIKQGQQHKKVKNLFNEMSIPTWERENIPFIYHGDVLISVGGLINNTDYTK